MRPSAAQKRAFRRTALAPVAGGLALMVLGLVVSVGLPLAKNEMQSDASASLVSHQGVLPIAKAKQAAGFSIYEKEGCVYCHTQQVRAVSNDLGLGTVTHPGQISGDGPNVLGLARVGPDLSCFGSRKDGGAAGKDLGGYLADPRSVFPGSKMPRYAHLEDKELADLSSYLLSLTCGGKP